MTDNSRFIDKLRSVHGDKYDPSLVVYIKSRIPVTLICNACGYQFSARPSMIVSSRFGGCPNCDKTERFETFRTRCLEVHGNRYSYDLVDYLNHSTKVKIVCDIHGEFEQTPNNHVAGTGCPQCAIEDLKEIRTTTADFVSKAGEKHDYQYGYDRCVYVRSSSVVIVTCLQHGDFSVRASKHLSGRGCPLCKEAELSAYYDGLRMSNQHFIDKANARHGNKFDYSKCQYVNIKTPITIVCPLHGEFEQAPNVHLKSPHGCPKCATSQSANNASHDTDYFIRTAKLMYGDRYDYSEVEYRGIKKPVTIICPTHGRFQQRAENHLNGMGCRDCSKLVSGGQQSVVDHIRSIRPEIEIIDNYRDRNDTGEFEIDIWMPKLRFGIEYHGSYWHSANDQRTDRRMYRLHRDKAQESVDHNFDLYQIYDFEYGDVWKSMISSRLGVSNRVGARKLSIEVVDVKSERSFYDLNHLQKYNSSTVCYALTRSGTIFCAMSFVRRTGYWEIQRFANLAGHNVIGGASRLFTAFVKEHKPSVVRTFADRRYSKGRLYETLGFNPIGVSKPNYKYVNSTASKVYSRQKCQKHKLSVLLGDVFNPNLTEAENMFTAGFRRLWDAGNLQFELKYDIHTRLGRI